MTARRGNDMIEEQILNVLKTKAQNGLRKTEVRRLLGIQSPDQIAHFRNVFHRLVREGAVINRRRGRYVLGQHPKVARGRISVHHRGFAFVSPEDGGPDIFIPPSGLDVAVSGDHVEVAIAEEDERGPLGHVQRVLRRGRHELTGEFIDQAGVFFLRPLRREFPEYIPLRTQICEADGQQAEHGDWVVARLEHAESAEQTLHGTLLRRLNTNRNLSDDLDAVVSEFSLPPPYPAAAAARAGRLAPQQVDRESCEHFTTVTIDPEDAKDFDDALSIHDGSRPETVIVGVHIADVAAYIEPCSVLDEDAMERGFTAYLPGRTLPMLPGPLASVTCSLREGTARPAHSVFLEVALHDGAVLSHRRAHTTVNITQRLSYSDVQNLFSGRPGGHLRDDVQTALHRLREVAAQMRRRRAQDEEFLQLATEEIRVVCQENPPIIKGLRRESQNESHQLVEEFMLAANVAVARELQEKKIPGLYRIHAAPGPADIKSFRSWSREALGLRPGHLGSRGAINSFLAGVAKSAVHDIVTHAFLRELPRAVYSEAVAAHFGLGKEQYSHFTSPIRRYPDLLVHQQLWAHDRDRTVRSTETCAQIARHCNACEQNNDEAYFAALDRLKLRYICQLRNSGETSTYEGVVARLMPEGLLVNLTELGLYGLVPREMLGAERFHLSKKTHQFRGRTSGRTFRCGHSMHVAVEKVDIVKGLLILKPTGLRLAQ